MDAAMDCLELLPDGCTILETMTSNVDDVTQRRAIYQRIAEHYMSLSQPLWSNNFADLHIALLKIKIDITKIFPYLLVFEFVNDVAHSLKEIPVVRNHD